MKLLYAWLMRKPENFDVLFESQKHLNLVKKLIESAKTALMSPYREKIVLV